MAAVISRAVFWGSAAALAWTHAGYPAAAALGTLTHRRRSRS